MALKSVRMITVLCGGVGAAKMLTGLRMVAPDHELLGIVNTGDDLWMHGLRICPDLDTITYTLAGLNNTETGWGLAGESWRVMGELDALGGDAWFSLGDRDLALHLYRTQRLNNGDSLSSITADVLAHFGVGLRLLPVSEDPIATRFSTREHGWMSFQEYFVKFHHDVVVDALAFDGALEARPTAGVLDAIRDAERIVISPSNPLISIGPMVAIDALRSALIARRDDVVVVSPLVGNKALKGPADRLLDELGFSASASGVARFYREIAGTLVIDEHDAHDAPSVAAESMRCVVAPTIMADPETSEALAKVVLHG